MIYTSQFQKFYPYDWFCGSGSHIQMPAVCIRMHSPHLPLKIPALTDGPVLISPARAGVCWSRPIVFGVHLQTSLPPASCCPSPRCCRSVSRCVCRCGGYSQAGSQPVDSHTGYSSQPFTPKAFTLFNCSSRFPQIYQDPKNDSECLSNITEFLKGCAVFRVEVSWCIYGPLTLLYVAALAPQWKQSTKETCSRHRRRNSGPMWERSCPAHRFIVTVWWDKAW